MRATFAADKKRPGSYLARVELTDAEPEWPEIGGECVLTRKDGSTSRVILGSPVWSGPDGEKAGVEVTLYRIERSLDEEKRRQPPRRVGEAKRPSPKKA